MIARPSYLKRLTRAVKRSPITSLIGPRQCGKTTLARMFAESKHSAYFDLESQPDARRLHNPELILGSLQGIVILDEIQEMPELFRVLRVMADSSNTKARFLILGSASPDIVKNVSETLAGRVEFVELIGFKFSEAPQTTKSMRMALEALKLQHLWIIHPGKYSYPIDKRISALPLTDIGTLEKLVR